MSDDYPRRERDPNRQVHRGRWAGDTDDGYDAMKDRALTGEGGGYGSWRDPHDRPKPKWFQEANRQRYREGVIHAKTKNAMFPGKAVEHGPPRP